MSLWMAYFLGVATPIVVLVVVCFVIGVTIARDIPETGEWQ